VQSGKSQDRVLTDASEERFFVGLRLTEGIEPNPDEWARFSRPIEKWIRVGMLEHAEGKLRLSPRGVLVSNEIFQEFIDV
jgi:oxygen-independent coproporphyrinogen-3 oxidase